MSVTSPKQTSFTPSTNKSRFKFATIIGFPSKSKKQLVSPEIQAPPEEYQPFKLDIPSGNNKDNRQRAKSSATASQNDSSNRYSRGVASSKSGTSRESTEGPLTPSDDPQVSYQHSLMTLTDIHDPFSAIAISPSVKRQSSHSEKSIGRRIMNRIDIGRTKPNNHDVPSPNWNNSGFDSRNTSLPSQTKESYVSQLLRPLQSSKRPSTSTGSSTNTSHYEHVPVQPQTLHRMGSASVLPAQRHGQFSNRSSTSRPHTANPLPPSLAPTTQKIARSASTINSTSPSHYSHGSSSTSGSTPSTATITPLEQQLQHSRPFLPYAQSPTSPYTSSSGSTTSPFDMSRFPRPPPTGPLPTPDPTLHHERQRHSAISSESGSHRRHTPSPAGSMSPRRFTPTSHPNSNSNVPSATSSATPSPRPSLLTHLQTSQLQQTFSSGSASASASTTSLVPPGSAVSFASRSSIASSMFGGTADGYWE
ncbi:hypothetical protein M422DRAFT_50277 [Sphaerobolus stellatus SS14]|uniref:Uncharacterized protein n=1 Tax=Sphaerobolus stellatus (strain SS14) TaxID=990650 RepID=A0A0C9VJ96_SPHS4|nr:hypothetical protein M422DRAFT_50277 [Sphaerobolus stellatus SS14]